MCGKYLENVDRVSPMNLMNNISKWSLGKCNLQLVSTHITVEMTISVVCTRAKKKTEQQSESNLIRKYNESGLSKDVTQAREQMLEYNRYK